MLLVAACVAAGGLVTGLAWREGRAARAARAALLDGCDTLFAPAVRTIAPDGFPRLSGRLGGASTGLALVPDTFAPKRLPQLWLVMTVRVVAADLPRLAVTARPRGEDLVTRGRTLRHVLSVPAWLPQDASVRAESAETGAAFATLRACLEPAFRDPRLKEIAIEPRGIRFVYQADEGARGAHLLLRQARFMRPLDPQIVRRLDRLAADVTALVIAPQQRTAA